MPIPSPRCPICSASARPAYIAAEYRMYRCAACRTAFVWPVPTDQQLERFYQTFHLSDAEGGMYDEMEDRMRADFPAKVRLILRAAGRKPRRLLDIGCGKGFFVKACADRGIDAQGIDLSETGVAYARDTLGVKAIAGDLARQKQALGTFDVVTFWATIEHLPDPVAMLRHIRDLLEPNGRLFLDTGIGADWLDRLLPGVAQWYDPPQHLFVFSREGMRRALAAAGFEVAHFDPCFDRTPARKAIRIARSAVVAAGLRASALAGAMRGGREFPFTRYPLGNLMSVVATPARAAAPSPVAP